MRIGHLFFATNAFTIIFNQHIWQNPLRNISISLSWLTEENLAIGKVIASQNFTILLNVFELFMRAQIDNFRTLLVPALRFGDCIAYRDIGGIVTNRLFPFLNLADAFFP